MSVRPAIKLTIVREAGQCAKIGLNPGDYLTEIGSIPVTSAETLAAAIAAITTPTPAQLVRNGTRHSITLQPGPLEIAYALDDIDIPTTPLQPLLTNAETEAQRQARTQAMIITTAPAIDGHRATRQLGIVTAECVLGLNLFADLFTAVRDVVGGRSHTAQKALRSARETCLAELKAEAAERGANAIIAVDLDYSEISGNGRSMLLLVASGTAVFIEP